MALAIIFTVLGALAIVVGLIGCIIPAIPGPVLAYLSLILISIPGGWDLYPLWSLIFLGVVALSSTVIDNILPAWASKKSGAGKPGVWGSVLGMVAGSIFFPLVGTIVGAFAGALLGELLFNRSNEKPFKAAMGVFKGTMLGVLIKITVTGVLALFFIRGAGVLLS